MARYKFSCNASPATGAFNLLGSAYWLNLFSKDPGIMSVADLRSPQFRNWYGDYGNSAVLEEIDLMEAKSCIKISIYAGNYFSGVTKLFLEIYCTKKKAADHIVASEMGEDPYETLKIKLDRGIETMFRVALRNHNQLSKIADNKANILLSINALMISIVISSFASKLDANEALIIPTVTLLLICLIAMVFAILATPATNYIKHIL